MKLDPWTTFFLMASLNWSSFMGVWCRPRMYVGSPRKEHSVVLARQQESNCGGGLRDFPGRLKTTVPVVSI